MDLRIQRKRLNSIDLLFHFHFFNPTKTFIFTLFFNSLSLIRSPVFLTHFISAVILFYFSSKFKEMTEDIKKLISQVKSDENE